MTVMQPPPTPPDELIDRVTSGFSNDEAAAHRELFDKTGRQSLEEFENALGAVGTTIASHSKVLEFGCGCGRIMRWMGPIAEHVELYGTDIDERAIEWAAANLSFARFDTNAGTPPTRYEDGQFDLILNHSVFTHLDAHYQDLWLTELRRITAPGGLLVLSVHGQHAFDVAERQLAPGSRQVLEWRQTLERDGLLFVADDAYVGSAFPDFYHTTFHAPWYLFEHWNQWFEVAAFLPRSSLGFQDQLVLRRRDGDEVEPPVRARPAGIQQPVVEPTPPRPASLEMHVDPSRFGAAGLLARRALFRVARPVLHAQSGVNSSLADAIVALEARADERMPPLVASVFRQQAERLERLEREVDGLRRSLDER